MNAAFLLLTAACLAGADPGPASGGDVWYCSWYDGADVGWCCPDDGWGAPWGWGGPGYAGEGPACGWCCQPAPKKEHCWKHLFHHHRHEDEAPCRGPWDTPCFRDYYATTCAAADNCWDCRQGPCGEKHCCLARLFKHFHHKERCLTPEEPPCCQMNSLGAFDEPPCEICFSKKHTHHPHHCHFHHHKAKQPAPCCPLCGAPCPDWCPVSSNGCCGAFDGWSGACIDGDCGTEYGGPAYGLTPQTALPAAAAPEKIGAPKEPKGKEKQEEEEED